MRNIDMGLYATDASYRRLIDGMRELEQKQLQMQMERDGLHEEKDAYYWQRMFRYANTIFSIDSCQLA